ncbi:MAG: hypothetical protein WCF33_14345, partial [Pseudonocardiaceae bacterium]
MIAPLSRDVVSGKLQRGEENPLYLHGGAQPRRVLAWAGPPPLAQGLSRWRCAPETAAARTPSLRPGPPAPR